MEIKKKTLHQGEVGLFWVDRVDKDGQGALPDQGGKRKKFKKSLCPVSQERS